MLYDGGMTRTASGQWYMEIPDGINDLSVMNFVDGYSFGPHAIFGYMLPSRQRFEVEETVRWAVSREACRTCRDGRTTWWTSYRGLRPRPDDADVAVAARNRYLRMEPLQAP